MEAGLPDHVWTDRRKALRSEIGALLTSLGRHRVWCRGRDHTKPVEARARLELHITGRCSSFSGKDHVKLIKMKLRKPLYGFSTKLNSFKRMVVGALLPTARSQF
jgi:hypothetical protein